MLLRYCVSQIYSNFPHYIFYQAFKSVDCNRGPNHELIKNIRLDPFSTLEDNGGIRGYPRILVAVGHHRNNSGCGIYSGDKFMPEENVQWWYQLGVELMMVVEVADHFG